MTNRYHTRNTSIISRDESSIERSEKTPSWLNDYVAILEKESTKPQRDQYSLFEQINSLMGNKSKYSTVSEAVEDMSRRCGLYDILQKKQANKSKYENIQIFKEIPVLKTYIDNYVEDRPGTSVEAVVHDILKIQMIKEKLPQGDDVPEEVRRYINDKIEGVGDAISHNNLDDLDLGKLDLTEDTSVVDDPLGVCVPGGNK